MYAIEAADSCAHCRRAIAMLTSTDRCLRHGLHGIYGGPYATATVVKDLDARIAHAARERRLRGLAIRAQAQRPDLAERYLSVYGESDHWGVAHAIVALAGTLPDEATVDDLIAALERH